MRTHLVNRHTAETSSVDLRTTTTTSDMVPLPGEYQPKDMQDIFTVKWGDRIFVSHPDLKPQMLLSSGWAELTVDTGTKAVLSDSGHLYFETPRGSPVEQRDSFQEKYPNLVKEDQPTGLRNKATLSPEHYRKGKIEPWDFITSQGMGFLEGNVIKYVTRYKTKNGLNDLLKAKTYLEKLIKEVSCEK